MFSRCTNECNSVYALPFGVDFHESHQISAVLCADVISSVRPVTTYTPAQRHIPVDRNPRFIYLLFMFLILLILIL